MMQSKVQRDSVSIASGQSLSEPVNVGSLSVVGLFIPTDWTAADITFQVSMDGTNWFEMYDSLGEVYTLSSVVGGTYRPVNLADFVGPKYLRIRSGTGAAAVNQTSARMIGIVFREL